MAYASLVLNLFLILMLGATFRVECFDDYSWWELSPMASWRRLRDVELDMWLKLVAPDMVSHARMTLQGFVGTAGAVGIFLATRQFPMLAPMMQFATTSRKRDMIQWDQYALDYNRVDYRHMPVVSGRQNVDVHVLGDHPRASGLGFETQSLVPVR
jgi:hypothetical protein